MYPSWLNSIGRSTKEHSPVILSGIAIAGVVSTAVLAAKGRSKAEEGRKEILEERHRDLVTAVKEDWQFYIPAGLCAGATIACIIGANKIGARRNAALLAAYKLADQSFKQYKDEVLEQIGENKERKVRDALAVKKMEANPNTEVVFLEGSDVLCYEEISGRYFRNDHESIRKAANEIDSRVLHDMYASLNEFYLLIGLDQTRIGDELGWNIDRRIELIFTSHLSPKGEPCLGISYKNLPVFDYGKVF